MKNYKYLLLFLFAISVFIPKPVFSDTFGYTTQGASITADGTDEARGSLFTSPANISTADNLSIYAKYTAAGANVKGLVVLHSGPFGLNIIANGVGNAIALGNTIALKTSSFSTLPTLSTNTEYVLMFVSSSGWSVAYDTGGTNQGHYDEANNYITPINPTGAIHSTHKCSIYATYTPAGGGAAPTPEVEQILYEE